MSQGPHPHPHPSNNPQHPEGRYEWLSETTWVDHETGETDEGQIEPPTPGGIPNPSRGSYEGGGTENEAFASFNQWLASTYPNIPSAHYPGIWQSAQDAGGRIPDGGTVLSALTDYQQGYGAQYAAAQSALDLSYQQLAMTQAIVDRTLSLSEHEQELAEEQWEHYQEIYEPGEVAFVGRAFEGIDPTAAVAAAQADVRGAFSQEQQMIDRTLQGYGLDPSDPMYVSIGRDIDTARAAAEAGAMTQARQQVEAQNYARRRDVVGLGRGLPSESAAMAAAGGTLATQAGQTGVSGYGGLYDAYDQIGGLGQQYAGFQHDVGMANLEAGLNAPSGWQTASTVMSGAGDLLGGIGEMIPL